MSSSASQADSPAHAPAALSLTVRRAVDIGARGEGDLARLIFGADQPGSINQPGLLPAGGEPMAEIWRASTVQSTGTYRGLNWRATDDFMFGWISAEVAGDCFEPTRALYDILIEAIAQTNFPHLLRVWNFVPNINQGIGDGEQYKRFCRARALALREAGIDVVTLPAATAVGTADNRLLVYFISATVPGHQFENARQISAYHYPRRYGRLSPQFSRATLWQSTRDAYLFVSGTASIVGHESRHPGKVDQQLREAWRNLNGLCEDAGCRRPLLLRAYVRREGDQAQVQSFLASQSPRATPMICLQADICRAELLVEVEGIFTTAAARGRD